MTPPIVFIILIKLMPRPSYHFFSFVWIKMMADRKPFPTPFMEIKNVNDVDQKEKVLEKYLFSTSQKANRFGRVI